MNIAYRLQGVEFEWDDHKALSNLEKHGVAFEEASEVFLTPSIKPVTLPPVITNSGIL